MKAKNGDKVKINYIGKLDDGSVFDTTEKNGPIECKLGEGQLIKGFEEAVIGMSKGENKSVKIPPEKAYGEHRKEGQMQVPRDHFPANIEPKAGLHLKVKTPTGQESIIMITDVSNETLTIDANHPLAGKTLNFDIELVEIGG